MSGLPIRAHPPSLSWIWTRLVLAARAWDFRIACCGSPAKTSLDSFVYFGLSSSATRAMDFRIAWCGVLAKRCRAQICLTELPKPSISGLSVLVHLLQCCPSITSLELPSSATRALQVRTVCSGSLAKICPDLPSSYLLSSAPEPGFQDSLFCLSCLGLPRLP